MEHSHSEVENRLERIESNIRELSARLAAVESVAHVQAVVAPVVAPVENVSDQTTAADLRHPMALMGRSVLILGGAFVLRALTESAVLPPIGGVAAGLIYAVAWILLAHRAAGRGKRGEALFDCASAAVIAYPLVWETTVRFRLMSATAAVTLLLTVSLILLWIASRDRMEHVAWIATSGAAVSFIAIALGTGSSLPAMLAATIFAVAAVQLSARASWEFTAWPAILASDLLALHLIGMALLKRSEHSAATVVTGLILFAAIWIAAIIARALLTRSEPTFADIAQSIEVAVVGLAGATIVAWTFELSKAPVAWFALASGIMLLAIVPLAANSELVQLRVLGSGLGAFAVLFGSGLLFGRVGASIVWGIVAVAAAELARRRGSSLALRQSIVWALAAAIASGIPTAFFTSLASAPAELRAILFVAIVTLLTSIAYTLARGASSARLPRVALLAITATGAVAVTLALITQSTPPLVPMYLALLRTAVLALFAAGFAIVRRFISAPEAAIVARALLAVGAIKLLLVDIRVANAAVLVGAFVIYGSAMLITARAGSVDDEEPGDEGEATKPREATKTAGVVPV